MCHNKKKLIRSIILVLLISAVQNTAIGQQTYDLEKVVPPSPTAAALGAYGDVPVSYYTGQASLGIPLYQIKTSQHQLNIDLSYNSSIRVNQDASWVGLGWSLNAGGVITRSVRGIDDFDNDFGTLGQGYYYAPALPATDYDPEDDPMDPEIYSTLYVNDGYQPVNNGSLNPEAQYIQDAMESRIDTEPDIFYYNFAGYSGSFVLGKQADGSVVYLKNSKDELKIEIDFSYGSEFGKWNATTPDGYIYHFATVETSENLFTKINLREDDLGGLGPYTGHLIDSDWEGGYAFKENAYDKQYATAWYLDYIEAPNGERMTFGYANDYGSTYSNTNISQTRYDKLQDLYVKPYQQVDSEGVIICQWSPEEYDQVYNNIQATKQIIHNVYLESITFENGHVLFETSNRKDIEKKGGTGPQKLSGIKVYSGNKQIKNIILDHDYFNTSHQDGGALAHRMCRLKLEKIYESGKPPYEFEYFDPNGMPSKYDKHVDDWGFYNPLVQLKSIGDTYWIGYGSQQSAPTWLPEVEYNGVLYSGTTRKPDDTGLFSRRGMLKKVTYPTGGNTVFDYEPNVLKLNVPETIETYEGIARAENSGNLDVGEVHLESFYVTSGSYKLSFWGYETYADPPMSNFEVAWLKNSQGTVLETFYLTDPEGTYESRTVTLASGTYTLEVPAIYNYALNAYFGKTVTSSKYYKTVGGQRIAKITNRDANDAITSLKKIIYTENGLDTGNGSGYLLENHKKYEITEEHRYAQSPCDQLNNWVLETKGQFLKRSSNSLYPIGFNSPNGIVGYRTVYELFDENGDLGKTRYDFRRTLPKNYNSNYYGSFLNLGDVTKTIKYNDIGDPVQKTETSHSTKELKYLYGINTSRLSNLENPCPLCPLDDPGIGYPIPYNLDYSEWYVVDQATTTEYDDDFEETLKTIEKFNYDNPGYKSITSKNLYSSKGEEFKTTYSYPYNFPTTSTYQQMVSNHIIAPVVKEEHFKIDGNGLPEFLMGKTVNYENQGGKIFRPTSIVSDKAYSPVDPRIEYGYDAKGNMIEANKTGGAHTYYVWGYKEQYPIAKIENFSSTVDMTPTISGLIASAKLASNSDGDNCMDGQSCGESNLRTALGNLRSALPTNAMMSSYTFDPYIGVTSMTDPKSYTVYYKYDSYNRLQYIKDAEGHVVNETKYRYKQ